jgi:hypothetical protein
MLMRFSHAHEVILCKHEGFARVYRVKTIDRTASDANGVDPERRKKTELAMKLRDSIADEEDSPQKT